MGFWEGSAKKLSASAASGATGGAGRAPETKVYPVLCKLWQEDDVWNGSAEHLAVAVFGHSYEEAQKNLSEALVSHFQCWVEAGRKSELLDQLSEQSSEQVQLNDIAPYRPFVNIPIGMHDNHVVAIT